MKISREQIERAEKILLGKGKFNQEQCDFINCNDKSIDLVACPGSGKTSALLAKLILLSEHMPFEDGRGICVLTHTNVAIDEIKNKLGSRSNILFSHPNFFGTIQSFVDTYFLAPFWSTVKGTRPYKIDNEYYSRAMKRREYWKNFPDDSQTEEMIKRKNHFLQVHDDFMESYRFDYVDNKTIIRKAIGGKQEHFTRPNPQKSPNYQDWSEAEKQELTKWFKNYKFKIHELDNVFSFDDAYFFAKIYLSRFPHIIPSFQHRFKYVFIDEMQDTDLHQMELIKTVFPFDSQNLIIQCIGDPNQEIYNDSSETESNGWNPDLGDLNKTKFLNNSLRFGENIASRIKYVCRTDISNTLKGNPSVQSLIPFILLYDDNTSKEKVLEKFAEILHANGIREEGTKKIKAIGRVGKEIKEGEEDKLTIKSYYKEFCSKKDSEKQIFKNLISFLRKQNPELVNKKGTKIYYDLFFDIFIEILEIAEVKLSVEGKKRPFTKTTLLKFINEKDDTFLIKIKGKMAEWALHLQRFPSYDETLYNNLKSFFTDEFFPLMGIDYSKAKDFLEDKTIEVSSLNTKEFNTYKNEKFPGVNIDIATIHAVKGETHKATLYLDTFYYNFDAENIIDHIKGSPYIAAVKKPDKRKKKVLKLAHVALSRSTDLVCFAFNRKFINDDDLQKINYDNNKDGGWIVVYC